MRSWSWVVLVGLVSVAACIEPTAGPCADGSLCGDGEACAPGGGCADVGDLAACAGLESRDPCESTVGPGTCRSGVCVLDRCGNGLIDLGEACDDGNAIDGDGCARDCASDETCGNGVRDPGEACDDGNPDAGDACQPGCVLPACGDASLDALEACDDGNRVSGDGCAADCGSDETCGNATTDIAAGEECDDGNLVDHDGCQASCRVQRCGDDVLDVADGEVCDDGNLASGDGCAADCRSDETCGNEVVDPVASEQCDAGAGQSYDGCSSDCAAELPVWSQWHAPTMPVLDIAMATDPAHDRVVVYGGGTDETWVFAGDRWARLETLGAPPARYYASLVYDADRQRLVLFGGYLAEGGDATDTWELDGSVWTQVVTATSPPARYLHAMAYDPERGRTVVFGGVPSDATAWEYDGTDWHAVVLAGAPPPVRSADMAFAPSLHKLVMFGGVSVDGSTYNNDTWTYDGASWVKLTPAAKPTPRYGHRMVLDPGSDRIVAFGGSSQFGDLDQTWEFSGATWTQRNPTTRPSPRVGHGIAVDPVNDRAIILGGRLNGVAQDDTWALAPSTWEPAALAPTSPPARRSAVGGYDEASGEVVIYGGEVLGMGFPFLADTWRFDGVQWRQQLGAGPVARRGQGWTYDSVHQRFLMFGGGMVFDGSFGNETWALSAAGWQQLAPLASPPPRNAPGMAFDRARGVAVVFGGSTNAGDTNETWEFDGTTWSLATPAASPPSCVFANMTYDDAGARTIMRCGIVFPRTTWAYDGTTWTQLAPNGTPGLVNASLAYDPLRRGAVLWDETRDWLLVGDDWVATPSLNRPSERANATLAYAGVERAMVLFGGDTSLGQLGETYLLRLAAADPVEACVGAADDPDGDGLAGCDDPDCAARCTPHCPPGATCADEATLPRCGDGTCNPALEDAALCPGDCP